MADTTLLRERVCKALKIQTLADDAAVGDAVEEAAVGAGNLKSLLEALGVAKPEEAMKVLPELRSAREKLAGLLSELDALLAQEQAQDAEVAKVDIGAAMKAQNFTGAGAERALAAYRSQCVGEELRKVEASKKDGETIKLSELREALKKGRERFLTEYNVKANEHASLATPLVAGRGGAQLAPPTASRVLPPTERDGEMPVLDLRGCAGRNPTEKLISHLKKAEPGFDKLALETQIQRASAMRKTHELTL